MSALDFIGVPYSKGGRGPDSFDCWGLVLACVPGPPDDWRSMEGNIREVVRVMQTEVQQSNWEALSAPCEGAGVLMYRAHRPCHAGIWERGYVVHATQGMGVIASTLPEIGLLGYGKVEFYRWRE